MAAVILSKITIAIVIQFNLDSNRLKLAKL